MAANVKQTTTKVVEPKEARIRALAGRVGKLNQLARQHTPSGGKAVQSVSAKGIGGGNSPIGGGGAVSGKPADAVPLPAVKPPKKKKQQPARDPNLKSVEHPALIRVKGDRGTYLLPAAAMGAGGVKSPKKSRDYKDAHGRVVATTQVVNNPAAFAKRMSEFSSPHATKKAVGIATSSLYHGSHPMEMDFVKDGVRGTRVAGNQYLDIVETGQAPTEGCRLTFALVNPSALGAILKKMSQIYEQVKFNHFRVVYKPVVPTTTDGAIALYFRNDTSNPIYETGLDELKAASSHQSFIETQVWNACHLEVKPSDIALKYWDEASGDFATEVQGMITVIATSSLLGSTTYGHLYLEYDAEFFSPELDYEVDEADIAVIRYDWNDIDVTAGNPLRMVGAVSGAGVGSFQFVSGTLPSGEYLLYGVVSAVSDDFATGPEWCTLADNESHQFEVGQGFYIRFSGTTNQWLNSTMSSMIFADLDSASGTLSDDDPANGQLVYKGDQSSRTAQITFRMRTLAMAEGQE